MFKIVFLCIIILVLIPSLIFTFFWFKLVIKSIKLSNKTQIKYSFVKAREIKKWGNKHYFILKKDKVVVYQSRTNMEFLYEIYFPEIFILTVYGVAILSSPIQLALIYKYIKKLKKVVFNKNSLYSSNLFNNKFNV